MNRAAIVIATLIGATVLAHYGLVQQPGAERRTEQARQGRGRGGFGPAESGKDLKELLPYVRPRGLILAHNMRRPAPNPRYVEAITTSVDLDTSYVLMDGAGLGITLKKR